MDVVQFRAATFSHRLSPVCWRRAADRRRPSAPAAPPPVQGGRILLKGGCVLSLDPQVGDFETRRRPDRRFANRRGRTEPHRGGDHDRRVEHDRDARFHRHAPAHVAGRAAQQPSERCAQRLHRATSSASRGPHAPGGRPHRRPGQRARRDQRGRDDGARLVAHRQQPGAHGRGDRRAARIGRPRRLRIRRGSGGPANQFPDDIRRLRKQHFSSTGSTADAGAGRRHERRANGPSLATSARRSPCTPAARWRGWKRRSGPTSPTFTARRSPRPRGSWWPHRAVMCRSRARSRWRWAIGVPPIQQSLDHGIRPSLSVDVETEMPGDMFTQMRSVFTLQRMLALNPAAGADRPQPRC